MKKIALFFIPLLFLTGCALTRDHLSLNYEPSIHVEKLPTAEFIHAKVQVTDHRKDKEKVSCKKNVYGMKMAPIVSETDVAMFIQDAIALELSFRGFKIDQDLSPDVIIDVELMKFYNDFQAGFFSGKAISELIIHVKTENQSQEITYHRNIIAEGLEPSIQLSSGKNAKRSLENALRNAMDELLQDEEFIQALLTSNEAKVS